MKIGEKITGVVKGIQPYGVFLLLPNKCQGLIHISECQSGYVGNINQLFTVGQTVQAMIIDIDEYSGQISLSLRAMEERPTPRKYGSKHTWTQRKTRLGVAPLAAEMNGFVCEALKKYKNA